MTTSAAPLTGAQLKLQGLSRASLSRKELLCAARMFAHAIAQKRGSVTIDDVMDAITEQGFAPEDMGNASGSVFRSTDWTCIGWEPSRRASNHARYIRRWRLK